jgi:SAM-dependent methyltransferase
MMKSDALEDDASFDAKEYWNKRSKTFGSMCGRNRYIEEFIERLAPRAGATVLDMGCATGSLAMPLAKRGHAVRACDFSPDMLKRLDACIAEMDDDARITTKLMDWHEDWDAAGLGPDSVDIAIASRSIPSGSDNGFLRQAIEKLDRVARERVAVTVPAGPLPALEPTVLMHLGRAVPNDRTDAEAIAILADMNRFPQLSYIDHPRPMVFESFDEGASELRRMVGRSPLSPVEEKSFNRYAESHFRRIEHNGAVSYQLDYPLTVHWAFITWATR